MNIIKVDAGTCFEKPCVATIGFFDGVHIGHQFLIRHVRDVAAEFGLDSMVVTFDRHPRQVLHSDYQPVMLSSLDEKLAHLASTDIDNCALLQFNKHLASLSAHEFMEKVLLKQLNVKKLLIGYDNRFGHDITESFDDYVRFGNDMGMDVIHNPAFEQNGVKVSSSVVRSYLLKGEVEIAAKCLGYNYTISGMIVKGFQKGREMGFPTANLDVLDDSKLIPAPGVYAVGVVIGGEKNVRRGMMNIGTRPTFNGDHITLETHILHFDGNLYGKTISVNFVHRIREEQKFESEEALAEQLCRDEIMVEQQFDKDKEYE
nr:riboflavin biosynthesis protein RibF [Prevotella sp.]